MIRTKDYLSWSQYSLWHTSKREYWKRYGLKEEELPNKFYDKGKELANALETGINESADDLLKVVLMAIPRLEIPEQKLEVAVDSGEKLLCYIDSGSSDYTNFIEYKTGKIEWTKERVASHKQLDFYALAYYIASGRKVIPECKLVWIETEEDANGNLVYSGCVSEFERKFTMVDLEWMEKSINTTISEIEDFEYNETPLEDELVDRYIEIEQAIYELIEEKNLIKLEVKVQMEADNTKYASSTYGKFSISETKRWTYSEELSAYESLINSQIKSSKIAEQKNGKATYEITKSLRFSLQK